MVAGDSCSCMGFWVRAGPASLLQSWPLILQHQRGTGELTEVWHLPSGLHCVPRDCPSHLANLVILHVLVGPVLQQHQCGIHVVHGGSPVQSRLTCGPQTEKVTGGLQQLPPPCSRASHLPRSSTALTSACELMRSSNMPSTARRAARINGVVPSCMRASRSVARFRIRIWAQEGLRQPAGR